MPEKSFVNKLIIIKSEDFQLLFSMPIFQRYRMANGEWLSHFTFQFWIFILFHSVLSVVTAVIKKQWLPWLVLMVKKCCATVWNHLIRYPNAWWNLIGFWIRLIDRNTNYYIFVAWWCHLKSCKKVRNSIENLK